MGLKVLQFKLNFQLTNDLQSVVFVMNSREHSINFKYLDVDS